MRTYENSRSPHRARVQKTIRNLPSHERENIFRHCQVALGEGKSQRAFIDEKKRCSTSLPRRRNAARRKSNRNRDIHTSYLINAPKAGASQSLFVTSTALVEHDHLFGRYSGAGMETFAPL